MKHLKNIALLAFAILAACTKDEINIPQGNNPPPPPPPPPPPNQVWADTGYKTPVELGTVLAPCIYVTTFDRVAHAYYVEKYDLTGAVRQGVAIPLESSGPYWSAPVFSRKAELMAFGEREAMYVWNTRTNKTELICKAPEGDVGDVQFSPNIEKLAFSSMVGNPFSIYGNLYVVDAHPGAIPVNVDGISFLDDVAAFSPDGRKIAYTSWGTLNVMDLVSGKRIDVQKDFSYWTGFPVFTPDGQRIIYASDKSSRYQGNEIYVTDVAEGAEANAVKLTAAREYGLRSVSAPLLSPDGNTLYFLGETYTDLVHLYAMPANGGAFRMVAPCVSASGLDTRLTFIEK